MSQEAAGQVSTFHWGPAGDLLKATIPDTELTRTYDPVGRMLSETVGGRTLHLVYDAAGQLVARRTPAGAETTYAYDAAGNRTALIAGNHTLASAHDAAGRETTRRIGDALTLTHTWDRLGRLTTQSLPGTSGHTDRAYSYRADGHLIAVDDHLSGRRTFGLDAAGRVTAVHADNWTETYAYDGAGNQTHATWPSTQPAQEATGPPHLHRHAHHRRGLGPLRTR
ncbi:hypothetical protein GCM10017744_036940 [Streptomyces antimycoticus]|uniref:Type IV secretion protein Rhs n=1 Tax=Streptomyces antimycoticus TaxID=68175 RepID=A0A4D4KIH4_9ACTN|nr:hypothetical protein SANT12839_065650 [Streptomyces antimycoticus]